jgi:NitT/TauT family transport system substrate-binding protein
MRILQNRRSFLTGISAIGVAGLTCRYAALAQEKVPETTTVRLPRWKNGAYCWAPLYIAGQLLRAEGFTVEDVQGDQTLDNSMWIADGQTDFDFNMPSMQILQIEAGAPIKIVTGIHTGCFEMIGSEGIRTVSDLRGKRIGVGVMNSHPHILATLMISYVGLDPKEDVEWIEGGETAPSQLFLNGEIDAFITGAPEPQILRQKKIGHTIISNALDRPWSHYFCCTLAASADYVERHPIATKHIMRAILKGANLCASDPAFAARQLVDTGYLPDYGLTLQILNELKYDAWREYDAEDSMRFYALRMQEVGLIKSSPQEIISKGTDWRFLNELKRELKT